MVEEKITQRLNEFENSCQKVPVQMLSHLGHSIDYNVVCTIETAEAIAAQEEYKDGGNLKIKPTKDETIVVIQGLPLKELHLINNFATYFR